MSTWLAEALSWKTRALLLTLLTANDFRLHLESVLDLWWRDPTFSLFVQSYPTYNEFWSIYWGLGFATALSLVIWNRKTKDTNSPSSQAKRVP